ncbi:cytochrome c [Yeosuana sp. MJ-SS3]|jgi:mono/diheme cytochrome c family protein|uniref:Cytochrome c n=1 Tax=Gilvirhabdus luticola TaxID=3079858 RepID=A0ABU3U4H3_9FLAO|nr:cytochrome c [Yeosuana sp. MJ-SS3]MDU8885000.1 cytochrome c [Yeosuana sp. MJ-SS3]
MKNRIFIISTIILGSFASISMISGNIIIQEPWKIPSKYVNMDNPYATASDDEKVGRILYTKHCKSCHGSKGHGDGTKAESIDTKVPDFDTDSFKKETDGSIYYKTIIGRDDMPSFEKKITDEEERWLVVNYIKSLVK